MMSIFKQMMCRHLILNCCSESQTCPPATYQRPTKLTDLRTNIEYTSMWKCSAFTLFHEVLLFVFAAAPTKKKHIFSSFT